MLYIYQWLFFILKNNLDILSCWYTSIWKNIYNFQLVCDNGRPLYKEGGNTLITSSKELKFNNWNHVSLPNNIIHSYIKSLYVFYEYFIY